MKDINFLSASEYVFLPSKKNTKVTLAIDNKKIIENTFNLYNPFSFRAKCFKKCVKFFFLYFHVFAKFAFNVKKGTKSYFIKYLETILKQSLVSSVYFATTGDKVVIQLQSLQSDVVGYIKYPLNEIGLKHLENEKRAIEVLSSRSIIGGYLLHGEFDNTPFLLLPALEGTIGLIEKIEVVKLLSIFSRDNAFPIAEHPRVIHLIKALDDCGLMKYHPLVKRICLESRLSYSLVYEHGDFTPWNIIKVNNKFIPFDFEHFFENGLEHLDLIKYYYQIGRLLYKKTGKELIDFLLVEVDKEEFVLLFQLFLLKEIVKNTEENEPCKFEIDLLTELDE
jgi:hypothetical protein